jgi:hypothetical protein
MQEMREFLKGLATAARMDGLPNRWLSTEIASYCDLPPPAIERTVSSRMGVLVNHLPCRLELSNEDGSTWVGVEPLTVPEMMAGC